MRCESCSANCVTCVNQSVCTACAVSTYLYHSACLLSCPSNTFSSNTAWTCTDCPSVCPTCQSSTYCLSCLSNYYMDTSMNFCYICNSSCNTCFGPSGNQCLTCASPLVLKSYSCLSLDCPYGQYVDPIVGCKSCPLLYPNSVTCTYSRPLTCVNLYQPTTTGCVSCADVVGFHIIASTNTCT